ncbi:MAG: hypothetical protein Q7S80_01340 [bacterium]|nr:hypothetical protein [bacterium]
MTGRDVLALGSVVEFLMYFGLTIDPLTEVEQFVNALAQLDPRYKEGRDLVRYQLEQDQTQWPAEAVEAIMACANYMGMRKLDTPLVGNFDLVVALGGARQANLDRAQFAAKAWSEEATTFGQLIVAGSNRILLETEIENVVNYARDARTEFDLCVAAAGLVAVQWPGMITSQFCVLDERAGTPAILESLIGAGLGSRLLSVDSRIAVVTTQIYTLATELDLARVLNKLRIRAHRMVAGTPSDPETFAKRTTATYLSEVIRTLRAAALAAQAGV